jgi:hypothetical protein
MRSWLTKEGKGCMVGHYRAELQGHELCLEHFSKVLTTDIVSVVVVEGRYLRESRA